MAKLYLNVVDRMVIANSFFPESTSMSEYRLKKAILEKLQFTQTENTEYGIKIEPTSDGVGANMVYDLKKGSVKKPIDFTADEVEFLTVCARELDTKKKIDDMNFKTVEAFINGTIKDIDIEPDSQAISTSDPEVTCEKVE